MTTKKAYVPPVLRSHGTVRALTRLLETSPEIETVGVQKDTEDVVTS